MKNFPINAYERIMLRKRSLVETVFDYLKNKLQLQHTRHPSTHNFLLHIISTLIHYQLKTSKPVINMPSEFLFNP